MSRSVTPARAALLATTAAVTVLAGTLLPAAAGHAATPMTITSIAPSYLGFPTVAEVHISGTGLAVGDTVTSQPSEITFSQISSDGSGGLDAVATTQSAGPPVHHVGVTVTAPGGATAMCTACMTEANGVYPPRVTALTPASHSVTLSWADDNSDITPDPDTFIVSWTAPDGPTTLQSAATASTTIDGLTAGVRYTITVAVVAPNADVGPDTSLTEEVGVAPVAPTIEPKAACCEALEATGVDAQSWSDPAPTAWTWTWTPVQGGKPTVTTTEDQNFFSGTALDPRGYRVTATLRNQFGTSPPSTPVVIKPIVPAGAATHLRWRYKNGELTVHWAPPRNDGNSRVNQYQVDLNGDINELSVSRAPSDRTLHVHYPSAQNFEATVWAFTEAGRGESSDLEGHSGPNAIVTALDNRGHARWRYDDQGTWHGLGGHFTKPPTPVAAQSHGLFFFDTSHGTAWVRSRALGWQRLTSIPCAEVSVEGSAGANGLAVTCLSNGHLKLAHSPLTRLTGVPARIVGLPHFPASAWMRLDAHPSGGLTDSAASWTAFRVKPFDAAGDDIEAFVDPYIENPATVRFHRFPLACPGPVVTSGRAHQLFACKTGTHTISWYSAPSLNRPGRTGSITVPWRFSADFGLAGEDRDNDGYLITTDPQGAIHEQDLHQKISWTLGHGAPYGAAASATLR